MIRELTIRNFAIIESLTVSFDNGLTVLTGETGAGKSIIIDAIDLLLGGRGSSEFIRHGTDKAEVEGLFVLSKDHPAKLTLQDLGIENDDDQLILRREMAMGGKNVCRINGKLVNTGDLRQIGNTLVDIHSQHENQELMNPSAHLPLLDQFGKEEISGVYHSYSEEYKLYEEVVRQLRQLQENEKQRMDRLEMYSFQLDELSKAQLRVGEEEELTAERNRFLNFEKLHQGLSAVYDALQSEGKALEWLGIAKRELEEISKTDPALKSIHESFSASYFTIDEVASDLLNRIEGLEYDPVRANEVEMRLDVLYQLKRKYGKSIAELMDYTQRIETEVSNIQNREIRLEQLQQQMKKHQESLNQKALSLRHLRKKYAVKLKEMIEQELRELHMEKTVFEVKITELSELSRFGVDQVEFYLSPNPGEPVKPLTKIASGGELSRIMLGLKNIFARHQSATAIIFDEVDTGVSGRVAQAIAEKIYKVSVGSQVLCISHLPQVAAMADIHLLITKEMFDGRTKTAVVPLKKEDQVREVARMISGSNVSEVSMEHANELIENAMKMK